ncbi:hypothetical protein BG32_11735 [Mesotoga sp. HF07.pep.5.2.highcov]|nr:hypothetical protein BG32_11735 [Mesotoga sp. HF07.pep.5.2.highcov]
MKAESRAVFFCKLLLKGVSQDFRQMIFLGRCRPVLHTENNHDFSNRIQTNLQNTERITLVRAFRSFDSASPKPV